MPSQSDNPENIHYKDLFNMWANGDYFPVYFSREKIEDIAAQTLILSPVEKES